MLEEANIKEGQGIILKNKKQRQIHVALDGKEVKREARKDKLSFYSF